MNKVRTLLVFIEAVLFATAALGEHIAITSPRPLLEAARTISARSGVPLSYEDPLANESAGSPQPVKQSSRTAALPSQSIGFDLPNWPEPFKPGMQTTLMEPGNIIAAIKVVGDVFSREPANRPFKIRQASDGRLFIGPSASLLDVPIDFPGIARLKDPWPVLQQAIEEATGLQISASAGLGWDSEEVEPMHGSARDVLLRILDASRHWGAIYADDAEVWLPKFQWDLIAEPDAKAPGGARYGLTIRALQIEYRDAQGKLHQTSTVTDRVVDTLDPDEDEP